MCLPLTCPWPPNAVWPRGGPQSKASCPFRTSLLAVQTETEPGLGAVCNFGSGRTGLTTSPLWHRAPQPPPSAFTPPPKSDGDLSSQTGRGTPTGAAPPPLHRGAVAVLPAPQLPGVPAGEGQPGPGLCAARPAGHRPPVPVGLGWTMTYPGTVVAGKPSPRAARRGLHVRGKSCDVLLSPAELFGFH